MATKNNILVTAFATLVLLVLNGCTKGLDISDEELVKRVSECHTNDNKTPGMAVSCGNFQKECLKRGKASGNYIC